MRIAHRSAAVEIRIPGVGGSQGQGATGSHGRQVAGSGADQGCAAIAKSIADGDAASRRGARPGHREIDGDRLANRRGVGRMRGQRGGGVGFGDRDGIRRAIVVGLIAFSQVGRRVNRASSGAARVGISSSSARRGGKSHIKRAGSPNRHRAGGRTGQGGTDDTATDITEVGDRRSIPGRGRAISDIRVGQIVNQDHLRADKTGRNGGRTVGDMQFPGPIVAQNHRSTDIIGFHHRQIGVRKQGQGGIGRAAQTRIIRQDTGKVTSRNRPLVRELTGVHRRERVVNGRPEFDHRAFPDGQRGNRASRDRFTSLGWRRQVS